MYLELQICLLSAIFLHIWGPMVCGFNYLRMKKEVNGKTHFVIMHLLGAIAWLVMSLKHDGVIFNLMGPHTMS